jgi:hypothetical protein
LNILKSAAAQTAIENSSNQNLINNTSSSTNAYSLSSSSSNYVDYNNNNINNNDHRNNETRNSYQQQTPVRASYAAGSPVHTANTNHSALSNGGLVVAKEPAATTTVTTTTTTSVVDYDINQFKNDFSDLVKANMKLIFEQFDKDNDGKISKQELNFVMCNLFPDELITENDINEMLHAADLDNNGFIEFEGN